MTSVPHSGAKSVTPGGSVAGGEAPQVGDWCVITGQWRVDVGCISKVTDKQIRTHRHGGREAHHARGDVVFWGGKSAAEALRTTLLSLDARLQEARSQLNKQHADRVRAAIAKATAGETRNAEPIHRRDGDEG